MEKHFEIFNLLLSIAIQGLTKVLTYNMKNSL